MAAKHKGLGRGLGALISDGSSKPAEPTEPAPPPEKTDTPQQTSGTQLAVDKIVKSPWQPRREFNSEALAELVESVQEHGVLQPLLVRSVDNKFELIAGERRFRAAQAAGLKEVPGILLDVTDQEALELALIENLQREDLNVIEEAEGYRLLAEQFDLTQEKVAERVGKPRATIANCMRLLGLPDRIKQMLAEGTLSTGHAKALLGLEIPTEQEAVAVQAVKQGLSVRDLEKLVKKLKRPPKKERPKRDDFTKDHAKYIAGKLEAHFSTTVSVTPCKTLPNGNKVKGSIEISYFSNEDLERLLEQLGLSEEL